MDTLLLDRTTWDLLLDTSGNIAKATTPYARAQDVSSAVRLFKGEAWYDTSLGVPYPYRIIGKMPWIYGPYAREAAEKVPGVTRAKVVVSSFENRVLGNQIQFESIDGETQFIEVNTYIPASPPCHYVGPNYASSTYVY